MKKRSLWVVGLVIIASTLLGGGFYRLLDVNRKNDAGEVMDVEEIQIADVEAAGTPRIVERVISSSQLWRPVQERVHDAVLQLFGNVVGNNPCIPYAPPSQGAVCGSGFFINDQGYIITNAHVVQDATSIIAQIPSLGKRIIDVEVVGMSPDRDLALLRVSEESLELIRGELGSVPYLALGDSDLIRRSDDVLALGYPLGQQSLKSTTGVISGREQNMIQMSAPINPGSSGGPLLNTRGEVIGINTSGIVEAQNVGYAIPVNDLRIILPDLHKVKILRRPFLGVLFNNATEAMTEYLGNPQPGGCYVVEVIKGSPLDKVGVKSGDMLYSINGYPIDIYGEMKLPFSEDKISIIDYVSRLALGDKINLIVYRSGTKKEFNLTFGLPDQQPIREVFLAYETIDYEIFAGMVVVPLTLNHIPILAKQAPGLTKYADAKNQTEPVLLITHIFPNSQLYRSRSLPVGATINEVNGMKVKTLEEFREAIKKSCSSGFLTIRASDNVTRKSENVLVVLPWKKILQEEPQLARDFRYPTTKLAQAILRANSINKPLHDQMKLPQSPGDLTVVAMDGSSAQ